MTPYGRMRLSQLVPRRNTLHRIADSLVRSDDVVKQETVLVLGMIA